MELMKVKCNPKNGNCGLRRFAIGNQLYLGPYFWGLDPTIREKQAIHQFTYILCFNYELDDSVMSMLGLNMSINSEKKHM